MCLDFNINVNDSTSKYTNFVCMSIRMEKSPFWQKKNLVFHWNKTKQISNFVEKMPLKEIGKRQIPFTKLCENYFEFVETRNIFLKFNRNGFVFFLKFSFIIVAPNMFIRGLPFIFQDLVTLVLQSANWQLYRKAWHFWGYTYLERFDIRALFVLFAVT